MGPTNFCRVSSVFVRTRGIHCEIGLLARAYNGCHQEFGTPYYPAFERLVPLQSDDEHVSSIPWYKVVPAIHKVGKVGKPETKF